MSKIHTVYVLVMESWGVESEFRSADLVMQGIRNAISGADIQFSFVPRVSSLRYLKDLLAGSSSRGELAGVVAVGCCHEVYRFLADAGIPTVVLGSLWADKDRLSSVDVDNKAAGRLLVECLAQHGHRRIAVFNCSRGLPGDNCFYDGIGKAMVGAKLPPDAVIMRFAPDIEGLTAQAREVMAMNDPPTGFIARSLPMARAMARVVSEFTKPEDGEVGIAFQDHATMSRQPWPYHHARPRMCFREIAALIGKMLQRRYEDRTATAEHVVIPVELCEGQGQQGSRNGTEACHDDFE